jgi:hypothetical protein
VKTLIMPPVTKKAAQAKKQQADCHKFGSLPPPQPKQGSDSEYKGVIWMPTGTFMSDHAALKFEQ